MAEVALSILAFIQLPQTVTISRMPATKDFVCNLEDPSISRKDGEGRDSDSPGKNQPKSSSESCSEKVDSLHDNRSVSGKFPIDVDNGESPGVVRGHWIPGFGVVSSRQPSFLEQMLLPGMRKDETSSDDESAPSQLTIFYAGIVNVYDNVPVDKAHAFMLLAGESCLAKSRAGDRQEQTKKETVNSSNRASLPIIRDLQAGDFLMARKNSLRRFLEKRHDRITSKGPYATGGEDEMVDGSMELVGGLRSDGGSQRSSLSPFPSRLGCFCPVPSSNRN